MKIGEIVEKYSIPLNIACWMGMSIYFLGVSAFAIKYPKSFSEFEIGLVFFGIGLSSIAMIFYWNDRARNKKTAEEIKAQLSRIEKMTEKWDFN